MRARQARGLSSILIIYRGGRSCPLSSTCVLCHGCTHTHNKNSKQILFRYPTTTLPFLSSFPSGDEPRWQFQVQFRLSKRNAEHPSPRRVSREAASGEHESQGSLDQLTQRGWWLSISHPCTTVLSHAPPFCLPAWGNLF